MSNDSGTIPYQQPAQQPTPPKKRSGFLDIEFTRFLTLWIVKVVWGFALVLIPLITVGMTIAGLAGDSPQALAYPVVGVVALVFVRLWLEFLVVVFRIANNTSAMARD